MKFPDNKFEDSRGEDPKWRKLHESIPVDPHFQILEWPIVLGINDTWTCTIHPYIGMWDEMMVRWVWSFLLKIQWILRVKSTFAFILLLLGGWVFKCFGDLKLGKQTHFYPAKSQCQKVWIMPTQSTRFTLDLPGSRLQSLPKKFGLISRDSRA